MEKYSQDSPDQGPLLGALLRLAHQSMAKGIVAGLHEAGFDDIQSSHFAVAAALWDYPNGLRITELATKARTTKQSMGELVGHLVDRHYLDRVSDPEDGRARLIRNTESGRKMARLARKLVRETEAKWARQVGMKRIEEMRGTLRMLLESESS